MSNSGAGSPGNCRFTKEHEWAKAEGAAVRIGISDHAQRELGDVVFVELPAIGKVLKAGESLGTVESVKAVSDVYAPVDGVVKEVNAALSDAPQMLNESPYDQGWMIVLEKVPAGALEVLLSAADYDRYVAEIEK